MRLDTLGDKYSDMLFVKNSLEKALVICNRNMISAVDQAEKLDINLNAYEEIENHIIGDICLKGCKIGPYTIAYFDIEKSPTSS